MSTIRRSKNKKEERLPVDKSKWGKDCNTYDVPPEYYYNQEFICCDCGSNEIWTAAQQKWWYEEAEGNINAHAKRCRKCRAHITALKEEQKRHMEEMATKEPHPNEKFFKRNT